MLSKINIGIGLAIILIGVLLSGCGASPEEQTATAVALTAAAATSTPTITPTFTPTPTNTPTPTPTPIPYDLSVLVRGEEDAPIVGASVLMAEIAGEAGTQTTDDVGQAFWYDLPGETVNLSISAPGYFPRQRTDSIHRGINQLTVALERDPHGLLPSEACAPGERLLYLEDFQDREAQGWPEVEFRAQGWGLVPHPDEQGNLVIVNPTDVTAPPEGNVMTMLQGYSFDNAVARVRFMPTGRSIFSFTWHFLVGPYQTEDGLVDWSSYQVWFDPPGNRVFRSQEPLSTDNLRELERTMKGEAWHVIEISTFDGLLDIWIDGLRFLTYLDPKPLPPGDLTMSVWHMRAGQSLVYFDDISICELTAPFVPLPTPGP